MVLAGGSSSDRGHAITVDSKDHAVITGEYYSNDAKFGTTTLKNHGNYDAFVARMGPNGGFKWAHGAGGSGTDLGTALATNGAGDSYVYGRFSWSAGFGTALLVAVGSEDVFEAAISAAGKPLWVEQYGGKGGAWIAGAAAGAKGDVYLAGAVTGTATFGTLQATASRGKADLFVARMNRSWGTHWTLTGGGWHNDSALSVAVDPKGNAYVTGIFWGSLALPGWSPLKAKGGYQDGFLIKVDRHGNVVWIRRFGGTWWDEGHGVALDPAGNVYVTGSFAATASFGSHTLTAVQRIDAFVAKVSPAGKWLWVVPAGGHGLDQSNSVAADKGGCVVAGYFQKTATMGAHKLVSRGQKDILVARVTAAGKVKWVLSAGGPGDDEAHGVAVGSGGDAWITGEVWGKPAHFPGAGKVTTKDLDVFVWKLVMP